MNYIDAALHITDLTALDAVGVAFAMPEIKGKSAICYARKLSSAPWPDGATVLAETPYIGDGSEAGVLEAMVRGKKTALAKWAAIRDLTPSVDPETGQAFAPSFWPAIVG